MVSIATKGQKRCQNYFFVNQLSYQRHFYYFSKQGIYILGHAEQEYKKVNISFV